MRGWPRQVSCVPSTTTIFGSGGLGDGGGGGAMAVAEKSPGSRHAVMPRTIQRGAIDRVSICVKGMRGVAGGIFSSRGFAMSRFGCHVAAWRFPCDDYWTVFSRKPYNSARPPRREASAPTTKAMESRMNGVAARLQKEKPTAKLAVGCGIAL